MQFPKEKKNPNSLVLHLRYLHRKNCSISKFASMSS